MARLKPESIPPFEAVELWLLVRPAEGHEYTAEGLAELEAAWHVYGARILADYADRDFEPWGLRAFGPP